ncbi:MAG: serine hydrolase [Pseudomonadota bacterium]
MAVPPAMAAPYAAMVMDARTGEVLHSRNADTRLHPASLTKMMTLYVAFEAIERGEISLDTKVRISKKAAAEIPSKLGLRAGSSIQLRYLIRASAVKSANDAATAIGEAISGSEAAFARRMNRTAKALGMTKTTFKNAHGLTESGHLSTARDMTTLGRRLFYDYPEYYNLFSRRSTDAGIASVNNTNRRLLNAYRGADGIKTGYTRAAGFNLVASAERGSERIIATVFGGRSTATRNARVAELLDMGFNRAPSRVAVRKPAPPRYDNLPAETAPAGAAGKTIRLVTAVKRSDRPKVRPGAEPDPMLLAMKEEIQDAVADANAAALASATEQVEAQPVEVTQNATVIAQTPKPVARPTQVAVAAIQPEVVADPVVEIVSRLSSSGGRHYGINVGRYGSRHAAEKVLLKTALMEMACLDGSIRKIIQRSGGFDANFMGLTEETADLACRRLTARGTECETLGPS